MNSFGRGFFRAGRNFQSSFGRSQFGKNQSFRTFFNQAKFQQTKPARLPRAMMMRQLIQYQSNGIKLMAATHNYLSLDNALALFDFGSSSLDELDEEDEAIVGPIYRLSGADLSSMYVKILGWLKSIDYPTNTGLGPSILTINELKK
eukprot:TRINITY_DN1783_c0_g1_i4.p1 TRINITY_DN1783_c0_g1~~TRINITY_DN1783_c0_g1_i4.p1  ORF type:complete len:147 (+),score=14.28 TRINITY_DN1783_c0_g1_i4:3-443(+)